jgi:hypothetical protein
MSLRACRGQPQRCRRILVGHTSRELPCAPRPRRRGNHQTLGSKRGLGRSLNSNSRLVTRQLSGSGAAVEREHMRAGDCDLSFESLHIWGARRLDADCERRGPAAESYRPANPTVPARIPGQDRRGMPSSCIRTIVGAHDMSARTWLTAAPGPPNRQHYPLSKAVHLSEGSLL